MRSMFVTEADRKSAEQKEENQIVVQPDYSAPFWLICANIYLKHSHIYLCKNKRGYLIIWRQTSVHYQESVDAGTKSQRQSL